MSEMVDDYVLDRYQVFLLCVSLLAIGISMGMYAERLFAWQLKVAEEESNECENTSELLLLKPEKIPNHIAVIMDGNRRFGVKAHSDPLQGHWAGGQTLVDFVQWCMADGVKIATVYAFSTENWSRDAVEVVTLMTIFAKYAETFKKEALAKNVKVRVLSTDYEKLPVKVRQSVEDLCSSTAACTSFTLNICLSYGGRGEIVEACKSVVERVAAGELGKSDINEVTFSDSLLSKNQPDPDILIRTSGEYRLSNFMLWQLAYSELFFVDKFWPQITQVDLRRILHQYSDRQRRFGK